jgi:RNA polymerase sigma-70 factor (ECF subfamily)
VLQQEQKEKTFIELITRHKGIIHKVCNVYAGELHAQQDLYQEIVVQLWKNFEKFEGRSSFSTWMYRVALNTAISNYRLQKRLLSATTITDQVINLPDRPSEQQEEQLQQLYSAIRQLSDLERAIVLLYLEDHSYKEMEEILGIKEGALRVKMNRLKEKIRQRLNDTVYGT